ncbi:MAG: SGNH/GDSL hydrolase family protein [Planctomycetaceae bacterium]|nr:SGNH/GDSL hydrolase family protein [Planctomycetaceae bacterium]MCB9951229.1 SGNH/GDSL hydrolase family protein [Planctomycetaceae bacterium]
MTHSPSVSIPQPRRRPSWKVKALAVIMACLLAVGLSELALRFIGYPVSSYIQPDAVLGSRLIPGYSGWQRSEGVVHFSINSAGWRDNEHSLVPDAKTYRIAVLGDSFSEAVQVELNETWWKQLEANLNAEGGIDNQKVEVLNFGVSGYGTTQEFLCLESEVWQYKPDMILLQFLPGNDVRNNSRLLEPEYLRPFYQLANGHLTLDESFRDSPLFPLPEADGQDTSAKRRLRAKHWLVTHSAICSLLYQLRHPPDRAVPVVEPGIEAKVFFPPTEPEWTEAWEITSLVLAKMSESCDAHNAELVVFTANNAIQVHPDQSVIAELASEHQATDVLFPDHKISEVAAENGFRFFSLTLPMRELAQRDHVFFHGFENTEPGTGHWNAQGHAAAGKLLAEFLTESSQ